VIEEDAVAGVEAVGFAVIDDDPVGVEFGDGVGAARVEGGGFLLWGFLDEAVEFGGGGLVESGFLLEAEDADGFEEAEGTDGVDVGGVFRAFEADGDVAHGSEVIDFVWLGFLDDADEVAGVAEVAVMEVEAWIIAVGVLVEVIDSGGIEEAGASFDAVDGVAFFEEEFGEVGTVLAGDSSDESGLHEWESGVARERRAEEKSKGNCGL
jgi:hypothetical protein